MKKEQKTNYKVIDVKDEPFNIIEQNEEFFICCGNAIATTKTFKNIEEATKHIKKIDWQMVGCLLIQMIQYHEKEKKIKENLD